MDEYRVTGEWAELPLGSYFYAHPAVDLGIGMLALIGVGQSPHQLEKVIIGRWYPDIAGYNWIMQPSRLIRIAKEAAIWIIARIVPIYDKGLDWTCRASIIVPGVCLAAIKTLNLLMPMVS
jgi:hypothetical protein